MVLPLLLFLAAATPAFEQFHVDAKFTGKPAAPVLKTSRDRSFRTMIRTGAADGPDFADHFTIVQWGCGAGCVQMVTVDAANGTIYNAPFKTLDWQLVKYDGRLASNDDKFEALVYKRDSRLLVVRGCPDEGTACATFYYEWTGAQFKLLDKVPAKPMEESGK